MSVPIHPEKPVDYANFRSLDDAKWIRRSCGIRVQRRQKIGSGISLSGTVDAYQQMRTIHAVISARLRSDGLTLQAQYQFMRDQNFFSALSSGVAVHLGSTTPPSTERTIEGYDTIDPDLPEDDGGDPPVATPFYNKGLRVDNWSCQDHGDGTSTVTVSLTQTSEWADE